MTSNLLSAEFLTVTEASLRGISSIVNEAGKGHDLVVQNHGKPVAAVIGMRRFDQLKELERDLQSIALVLTRFATDDGTRLGFDEVITSLGFNRKELEAELAADLSAGRE